MKNEIKEKDKVIKKSIENCMHDWQEYEQQMRKKEMYQKQCKRAKWYVKEPEVKEYCYYSESETQSEPEAYYNYGYGESDRKPLPPKNKK